MTIRRAEVADCLSMAQVVVDTWKVAYKGLISQSYLMTLTATMYTERFKRGIQSKRALLLVAEHEGRLIGVLQAHVNDLVMQIDMLYVLPQYQHQGVGKCLLDRCIRESTGTLERIALNVLDKNVSAKRFYARNGFSATGQKQESEINAGRFLVERFERFL